VGNPFHKSLLLDLGALIGVLLGNAPIFVFGHRMGKDKASAQEHRHDSQPMAEPTLALRSLALSHCNLLSAL
jgi:hypothetical protein